MPEGHSIRIYADQQQEMFGGQKVTVTSPQGRFAGVKDVDGHTLQMVEGAGKHLFYHFKTAKNSKKIVHVHLGRLGRFKAHEAGDEPAPSPNCRLRLRSKSNVIDLSGPTACHVISEADRDEILARLGPDPLRADADPAKTWERIHTSKKAIGALLLDQSIVAGLGNIFRAEVLFRLKIHPSVRGVDLTRKQFNALWKDAVEVMKLGVQYGWIVTTTAKDIGKPLAKAKQADRFYVYKRQTCRRCDAAIKTLTLASRTIYYCTTCQPGNS